MQGLPPQRRRWSDVAESKSFSNILPVLATELEDLCRRNDEAFQGRSAAIHEFSAVSVAQTAIADYLIRFVKSSACSKQVFVVMTVLLRRLNPTKPVNSLSVHRMIAVCFVIAAKLTDDVYYANRFYGKLSGLMVQDLNNLERTALRLLNWNLYVSPEDFAEVNSIADERPSQCISPKELASNSSFCTAKSGCESLYSPSSMCTA
eukprot:Hpha_TRINITY_DN15092_c0_g9::TRINITY_DN15092_c0_g9_i1::g.124510::m.124510